MNTTPTYAKWFTGFVPPASTTIPSYTKGQILASKSEDLGHGQPSDPVSEDHSKEFTIPYAGTRETGVRSIIAKVYVFYKVEDWGFASLNEQRIIDLTVDAEGSNEPIYGGHMEWDGSYEALTKSGDYELFLHYENIDMPREINRSVCEYSYEAKAIEAGGVIDPKPGDCGCSSTCSAEGGTRSPQLQSRSTGEGTSSSAGTNVTYSMTEDSLLWTCNTGTLRGLGTTLFGRLQLYVQTASSVLGTPAALAFHHPLEASLLVPEEGAVTGAQLDIRIGARVIALRCYSDGSITPIGVDTAGHGLATPTFAEDGTLSSLKWQDDSGAAWLFDGSTGALLSYTSAEGVVVGDVADLLQVKRDANGAIQQVWSYWDGLANIEAVGASGYRLALYTADQVASQDSSGLYTLVEGATPFKAFSFAYGADGLTVTESTPGREDYACRWSQGTDGAWSLVRGSGEAAVTTSRVRSVLEPATENNPFAVWQLVTTTSKGGVAASCTCDIYQDSPMRALLLTHVEGYGSDAAQTTSYSYDASGNVIVQVMPNGHRIEHMYDKTGRVIRSIEPWRGGDYTQITEYRYAYGNADRYSSELSTVTQKLHKLADNSMVVLNTKTFTRSEANSILREEVRTTASGSAHTHLEVTETWTNAAPNALDRGRTRMTQGSDGVQTVYTYAATTAHGALYTITSETQVEGAPVAGQSRRSVSYVNAEGNNVREEEFILLSSGTWQKLSGSTHSYNTQNQRVGTVHDNGRSSTRELTCTGELLWEINEDGVRTDYAYDSARLLIEATRAEVRDGETTITPETITEYVRDAAGRVTSTITRTGAMETTQSNAYDFAGRVTSRTDILGRVTTTAYSADGLTTTVITPAGATLITISNTDGSVDEQAGTGQQHLRYRYDLNGSSLRETILLVQDGGGCETETTLSQHTSNGFGEQTMVSTASTTGFIYTRSEYNEKGQLTKSYQDTGWNTTPTAATLYEYNSMGQQVKQTLALAETPTAQNSPIIETAYGAEVMDGNVYSVITSTRYNAEGTVLTSTQKQLISQLSTMLASKTISVNERNLTTTAWTEYNAGPKRTRSSTIPASTTTATRVSVDGFTLSATDHAGVTTTRVRQFAATGMVLTQMDGRGNSTTTLTDLAGRTTSVTDAAGNTSTTAYEACSDKPATITNAQGRTTCYRYDHRGRKIAEWGTAIQPASFAYDDSDRLTALTTYRAGTEIISVDPSERTDGDTTTWAYHTAAGLELTKTYADGKGTTKTYDAYNRLATETDGRGVVKTHSYEHARGLLLGTAYSDGTTARSYQYNHLGQLTQVTDDAGTRSLGYNAYGELETDSLAAGGKTHLITESYDSLGRSNGYTYAKDGATEQAVSYGYGADGRLNTAAFTHGGESRQFTYGYVPGSHLLHTLAMPNGMTLTQQYEPQRNLLTGMAYTRGDTVVGERSYTYDSLGRPLARNTSRQGTTQNDTFHHSNRNELTSADVAGVHYGYDYDNIGNRRMMAEGLDYALYEANELNQYSSINGAEAGEQYTFTPTFDDAGNQTSVKTETGIWTVTYNAENRPITFTRSNPDGTSTKVSCAYDYMGRRAEKKVETIAADNTATTTLHQRYLYRGYLQIAACDLTRTAHPCLWLITWDPTQPTATRPLAIQKDGTWYTYGWDLTKNICEVFGSDGSIKTVYSYTPYGSMTAEGNVAQSIQWSSEFYDDELGLVYYNYRFYTPCNGRWLARDFLEETTGINLYAYISNETLGKLDLLGLKMYAAIYYVNSETDEAESFKRAAQWWLKQSNGKEEDKFSFGVTTKSEFINAWNTIAQKSKSGESCVCQLAIFSHATKEGNRYAKPALCFLPTQGEDHGDVFAEDIARLNHVKWCSDAKLILKGCRTGLIAAGVEYSLAEAFAYLHDVTTTGELGYSYFSEVHSEYDAIDNFLYDPSVEVYLNAYLRRGNYSLFGTNRPGCYGDIIPAIEIKPEDIDSSYVSPELQKLKKHN